MTIASIRCIADIFGWREIGVANPALLSFMRDKVRLDIYYTTMTVATALKHPGKGKTQLFRRRITDLELVRIMDYPRAHVGKGYYKK